MAGAKSTHTPIQDDPNMAMITKCLEQLLSKVMERNIKGLELIIS